MDKSLILISDELLNQTPDQIKFSLLHDVGHVVLSHKNSIGFVQTPAGIKQQKWLADRFA